MMQPTVSPWSWSTWQRRARARAQQYEHARALHIDPYAFYAFRKDPLTGEHIKTDPYSKLIEDQLFGVRRQMPSAPPRPLWLDDVYRRHPWLADLNLPPDKTPHIRIDPAFILSNSLPGEARPAPPRGGGAPGWAHAARGWAAAGAVVLLLILLVRAAENCLNKRLFNTFYMHNGGDRRTRRDAYVCNHHDEVRRHESDEWSRPSVTATSQAHELGVSSLPHLESGSGGMTSRPSDLPPPYCECDKRDDPPPPYSACAPLPLPPLPAVHYTARDQHVTIHNQHNSTPSETRASVEATQPTTTRQLVFDNGRVVEVNDETRIQVRDSNETEATAVRTTGNKDDVASVTQTLVV